jgi:hypothetical protein
MANSLEQCRLGQRSQEHTRTVSRLKLDWEADGFPRLPSLTCELFIETRATLRTEVQLANDECRFMKITFLVWAARRG